MSAEDGLRLLNQYLSSHDLCADHAETLRKRWISLRLFAGVDRNPLDYDVINEFLASLALAPSTVDGYRRNFLAIWRFAADLGEAEMPNPRRLRKPKIPAPDVQCYTVEQASQIIHASETFGGTKRLGCRTPVKDYWPAILAVAWDTGLRRSDLWLIRANSLNGDLLATVSSKSGQRTFHRLHQSTVERLRELDRRNGDLLFPWRQNKTTFSNQFRAIRDKAGINVGTFKWFRRSSGSYVEAECPGAGPKHLGHSNPATFYKHYDARAVSVSSIMPPELT